MVPCRVWACMAACQVVLACFVTIIWKKNHRPCRRGRDVASARAGASPGGRAAERRSAPETLSLDGDGVKI